MNTPSKRIRVVVLNIALLSALLTGCNAFGGGNYRATTPSNSTAPILSNGPVRNRIPSPVGLAGTVPPGLVVYRGATELTLYNTSKQRVVLDGAQLYKRPGPDPLPHLLGAYVLTSYKEYIAIQDRKYDNPGSPPPTPLKGYRLKPGSGNLPFPPTLVLKMTANGPRSYNDFVLLAYHTLNGQRHATTYPVTYLLCNGPHAEGCKNNFP